MIRVKISSGNKDFNDLLLRQLVNGEEYEFILNKFVWKCDLWIVMHVSGLKSIDMTICNPENIYYFSMEPNEQVGCVTQKFLEQFSGVYITDRTIKHGNIIYKNIHTWWVGIRVRISKSRHIFDKNNILTLSQILKFPSESKINRISVINSAKNFLPGHERRINFIKKLKQSRLSGLIDIYGDEGIAFEDKLEAISKYKYHIVIENSIVNDYWSEKLADCYLAMAFPIYDGCPNINKYFVDKSYRTINIDNFDETLDVLEGLLLSSQYEDSLSSLIVSREKIIGEYNVFNTIKSISLKKDKNLNKVVILKPNYFFKRGVKKYVKFIKQIFV